MKLKLTIPTRPGLIFMLPVLDLIALVMAFPMMVSQLAPSGGLEIQPVRYGQRISSYDHAYVIELLYADGLKIYVDQELVPSGEFRAVLEEKSEVWRYGGKPVVLLKVDESISQADRINVVNQLTQLKFAVSEIGTLIPKGK